MKTGVPPEFLPIYAASNPPVPPFLPSRKIGRFSGDLSLTQQEIIFKKQFCKGGLKGWLGNRQEWI